MNHEQALLAAIVENPQDDTPRLIYADYIEGQGQRDRAEFIRMQCEWANSKPDPKKHIELDPSDGRWKSKLYCGKCRYCLLKKRDGELFLSLNLGRVAGFPWPEFSWIYFRGFVDEVETSCQQWLDHGAEVLRACPTIRKVRLSGLDELLATIETRWFWNTNWHYYLRERLSLGNGHKPFPSGLSAVLRLAESLIHETYYLTFATREEAFKAISRACIAYARNQLAKPQPVST